MRELGVAVGPHRGALRLGEPQPHAIAERRDLVGVDVELRVAEPVDPQHLGDERAVLVAGDRQQPGQQGRGSIDVAELVEVDAVAEVGGGRREHVAARRTSGRARAAGTRGWSSSTARSAPPTIATAGASSPLSGPTSTDSPSPTSTATARRSVPTPGSTTASTTPGARYCALRASVRPPPRTSCGAISWVRSMTATSGAIERITDFTTPTNSSVEAVVGQEGDRVVAAAHRTDDGTGGPTGRRATRLACTGWRGRRRGRPRAPGTTCRPGPRAARRP